MGMEKKGVVDPRVTPDTERKLPAGEKQASKREAVRQLDDDFAKRAADAATKKLS